MIWGGKKTDGRNREAFAPWYAWRPVHLIDRRWAWLEMIERGGYFHHDVPIFVPFNLITCWCYRAPEKK